MTAIPHGRPPFRHPGCSGHCAVQNPTPLSTLKFHDWRPSGRRFAGQLHFVSVYTDDVRFGSLVDICSAKSHIPPKADMCGATTDVRFVPTADIGQLSRGAVPANALAPLFRRYWCLQRDSAKAPQKNIAPNTAANQAGGPLSGGLLKMLIAPTQSATPMPRQVNRRIYFPTIIEPPKYTATI